MIAYIIEIKKFTNILFREFDQSEPHSAQNEGTTIAKPSYRWTNRTEPHKIILKLKTRTCKK